MFGLKFWIFIAILLSYLVNESVEQKGKKAPQSGEEGVKKAPPLTDHQIEFTKKWWKNLGQQQKSSPKQQQKKNGQVQSRVVIDDLEFLDKIAPVFFPMGDQKGLPADLSSMAAYCLQFLIHGITAITYTTLRWPQKILLKTMVAIAALTFLPTNLIFCLNPLSMWNFIKKAQIVNKRMRDFNEIHQLFKIRLANAIDHSATMAKLHKNSCCAWWDWKNANIATVDPAAKSFITQWYTAFFKIHEIVYCQTFTKEHAKAWCNGFEFWENQPSRKLPRSWITMAVQLFSKFF